MYYRHRRFVSYRSQRSSHASLRSRSVVAINYQLTALAISVFLALLIRWLDASSEFQMHPCFGVDEILRLFACELVASEEKAAAVALACCCKGFEDPVLDALWEAQDGLTPLLKCFPPDVWKIEDGRLVSPLTAFILPALNCSIRKSFERIPTKAEWAHSLKYARRMRKLRVDPYVDPVTSDIILALQLRTANSTWLSRLKTFECYEATEAFIPFIPLFLSPKTTRIRIEFDEYPPTVVAGSMISRLSTLCPDLECIALQNLSRNSVIIDAVAELLLGCNREVIREFEVDCPLTEEAREVVYQLQKLSTLSTVIQGPTSLPMVTLPDLFALDLEYEHDLDWLEGFRGATLGNLQAVTFHSKSEHIGDFLQAFESVALTTSAQNTLLTFCFCTSRSWNPNYSSVLSFYQLRKLEIEFSCNDGCSSKVDDDIIISLAGAMPKLEDLRLGGRPCQTRTGATVNGLIGLAYRCPHLLRLCIHFQATSLANAATSEMERLPFALKRSARREKSCALTVLEVGRIPIPAGSELAVTLILLQIFPHINHVMYINQEWKTVTDTIHGFRQIGVFVRRSGRAHML